MSTEGAGAAAGAASAAGFAAVLEAGGPALAPLLERTEERLAEVAAGHGERLGALAGATLAAGGKRLRPLLIFLCGAEMGGRPGAGGCGDDLVRAATAVELLHMATLVHDDVLDRAPLRRGRPTVFASDGRRAATATGDLLFSRAFAELVAVADEAEAERRAGRRAEAAAPPGRRAEAVRALSAASSALARGELMQRADAWSDSVGERRYLERCELKTARLFEAACRLGALLGEPGAERADALGDFGASVGLAFQILDDVLDVSGDAETTGKHRGTDLLDGTVTLPLIVARRRDTGLRELDLRSEVTTPAEAEAACERIAASGALDDCRELALRHVATAKAALAAAGLPAGRRRALDLVADGVVARYA